MREEIKVIILDNNPVFRRGLREIIQESGTFKVIGEEANGRAGLAMARELKPDIIILDVDMPHPDGTETARVLRKDKHPAKIIFLTLFSDEDMIETAVELGIEGCLTKNATVPEIMTALRMAVEGRTFYSSEIRSVRQARNGRVKSLLQVKRRLSTLTLAEKRIIKLIAGNLSSKEIADFLKISAKTVENHRLNICNKLDLHGSHSLLKFSFDNKSSL